MKKSVHAGHYASGRNNSILYDEENVHAQCLYCNVRCGGRVLDHEDYVRERHGQEAVDRIKVQRHQILKMSPLDHLEIEKKYKEKLKALKEEG